MSSEQVDPPKAAEGAPAQDLPSRPAKQPKEKGAKGGKKEGLEVSFPNDIRPLYILPFFSSEAGA